MNSTHMANSGCDFLGGNNLETLPNNFYLPGVGRSLTKDTPKAPIECVTRLHCFAHVQLSHSPFFSVASTITMLCIGMYSVS